VGLFLGNLAFDCKEAMVECFRACARKRRTPAIEVLRTLGADRDRAPVTQRLGRWLWLRHRPDSALSRWFQDRVKVNGGRLKKKPTIVALARKLLVALWKYVTSGVVIEGAIVRVA
jgi:hypothetical protein